MGPSAQGEVERLQSLRRHALLDTAPEREFDNLVALAAQLCEAPLAGLTLLDAERQWFKAKVGIAVSETHRSLAFCHHTVQGDELFEVQDTLTDPRFRANALVTGDPRFRFYAGVPLHSTEGYRIASLWVGDVVPRRLTGSQASALLRLAPLGEALLRLKFYLAELHAALQSREEMMKRLRELERLVGR